MLDEARFPSRADYAEARVLIALLGGNPVASRQIGGGYPERFRPTVEDVARHLAGLETLAFSCVENGRAWFLGFDFDERVRPRLPIVASCLSEHFGDAQIATTGSDEDRGKLIVFFDAPQSVQAIRRLASDLRADAKNHPAWERDRKTGAFAVYPLGGDGGLLRIGGRNPSRNGPLERFYDPVTGEAMTLSRVVPSIESLAPEPQPIAIAPQQPFVARWIAEGLTYGKNGTAGIQKCLVRLAHEAYRLRGVAGEDLYREWVEAISQASPDLRRPSPKNGDERDPLAWERRAGPIWKHVRAKRADNTHIGRADITSSPPPTGECNVRDAGHICSVREPDVASVLAEFVEKRGLNPAAFQVSYREIARALGISPQAAWRSVRAAVNDGSIVIRDPGTQGAARADKTIYALAGHENAEHRMVTQRIEKRRRYELLCAERINPERSESE